jgi:enoyl-CoA hydratase/carnithine racemase
MAYDTLLYEDRDGVAWVTLNRPEKLNALNRQVVEELTACVDAMERNAGVKAVIVTGAGDRAFAAGADILELAELDAAAGGALAERGQKVFSSIENLGKPVIAAVNGYALGGGCELAMACTLRVASENARFGQPEVKLGIIPGYGGTLRLPRLAGKGRALEMILTGERIGAEEAYRIGLVNRVVPQKDLMAAAEEMARKIMANAPLAVGRALQAVNRGLEMTQSEGEFLEATLFGLCCATQDMKEGTRAFLQARPPKFLGK